MKPDECLQRQHEVLRCLSNLPRMILLVSERNNVPEFVLHELCHPTCFNLSKAAFLVDNPDFDCMRGIVGLSRDEIDTLDSSVWESPDDFSLQMELSPFNQKVREVERSSSKRNGHSQKELIEVVADQLDLNQPSACYWNMKHDNHGILIFERAALEDQSLDEFLINGVSILSFCPIA